MAHSQEGAETAAADAMDTLNRAFPDVTYEGDSSSDIRHSFSVFDGFEFRLDQLTANHQQRPVPDPQAEEIFKQACDELWKREESNTGTYGDAMNGAIKSARSFEGYYEKKRLRYQKVSYALYALGWLMALVATILDHDK